jgi:HD-like signal output (HDOD) protein
MGLFRNRSKARERKLRVLLAGAEVPTFPELTLRVLEKIRDPESSMHEVSETIRWDPGLVTRLLALVNSAAYGPSQRIEDVSHAASYLGRGELEQFVLALAVRDVTPEPKVESFRPDLFWSAAACRAALCRKLGDELHPARQGEAFTIGLLQDMAVPVLASARPEEYGPVLQAWHDDPDARLSALEQERLGWTHSEVGELLGRVWELPEALSGGIARHHDTTATDRDVLPAVRLVALLRETEVEHGLEAVIERSRTDYGLDPDWTRAAVEEARASAVELARLFGG